MGVQRLAGAHNRMGNQLVSACEGSFGNAWKPSSLAAIDNLSHRAARLTGESLNPVGNPVSVLRVI